MKLRKIVTGLLMGGSLASALTIAPYAFALNGTSAVPAPTAVGVVSQPAGVAGAAATAHLDSETRANAIVGDRRQSAFA